MAERVSSGLDGSGSPRASAGLDLLSAYGASSVVVASAAGDVTCAALSGAVARIEAALSGEGPVIVACGDRLASIASFLAAARAGRTVYFPPGLKLEAVRELERVAGRPDRPPTVLHDQDLPTGVNVAALLDGPPLGRALEVLVDQERALAVFHTSGSTGTPSAHAKSAAHLVLECDMQAARLGLAEGDRLLATVPTHHVYGFLFGLLVPLRAGAAIVRETPVAPHAVRAEASANRANVLVSVPAHLRAIAALEGDALSGAFRHVVSSGAPLDPDDARAVERALGVAAEEVLGSTETGGIATRRLPHASYAPLPGVAVDVRGERLVVRSPYVAAGPDGWFETADRARLEPGGRFSLLGRADDVLKVGGKRVSTREVEARLRAIAGVREAFVRPEASTPGRGARLVALVEGEGLDPASLRAELAKSLDDVLVPRRIVVVPEVPRTDAGKVRAETVRALLGAADEPAAGLALRPRAGDEATYEVHVPTWLAIFEGHFPGDPLLPGVMQLRDLALASARRGFPGLGPLTRLSRVKFKQPIRPGADLVVVLRASGEGTIRFRIAQGDDECASGMLHFDRAPRPRGASGRDEAP